MAFVHLVVTLVFQLMVTEMVAERLVPSLRYYQHSAERGDAGAQLVIGQLHYQGVGDVT
jgi:TPR repeat protein